MTGVVPATGQLVTMASCALRLWLLLGLLLGSWSKFSMRKYRLRTAESVRPGTLAATWRHLYPCLATPSRIRRSSSALQYHAPCKSSAVASKLLAARLCSMLVCRPSMWRAVTGAGSKRVPSGATACCLIALKYRLRTASIDRPGRSLAILSHWAPMSVSMLWMSASSSAVQLLRPVPLSLGAIAPCRPTTGRRHARSHGAVRAV